MYSIKIHDSSIGGVLFPWGESGAFLRGKHQMIKVIAPTRDEGDPIIVQEALIGLVVPVAFTEEQLMSQDIDLELVEGSVVAYGEDVIKVLREAGKTEAKKTLSALLPGKYGLFAFPPHSFEFIE